MSVLVFGACGFIGPPVVRALLAAGEHVTAVDINPDPAKLPADERLALRRGNVAELEDVLATVKESGASRVINLAYVLPPLSESNPRLGLRVNVLGMSNVFEAARLLGLERVVYGSSVAAYGDQAPFGERPVTEDDLGVPSNLYGTAKLLNDRAAARYVALYGLDLVGVRIATVFGHGREGGNAAWVGKLPSLPAVGQAVRCPLPSNQKSAMIYVDDVADIMVRLCLAPRTQHRLYLTGGDTLSLREFADLVRLVVPDSDITFDEDGPDFPHIYLVDDHRLRQELGFQRPPLLRRVVDQMNVARAAAHLPPLPEPANVAATSATESRGAP